MSGLNMFANLGGPKTPFAPRAPSAAPSKPSNPTAPSGSTSGTQGMFKTLRRLHGQNLESQGLNDLTEAFQTFVTRAKFFSIGRLRRTWSHSAVEFMKYRRLLPMLVADEHDNGSAFDDFDAAHPPCFSARAATSSNAENEERRVTVTNISPRVTSAQLQSFFSKFGKVKTCKIPSEERKTNAYGTLPRKSANKLQIAHVTFIKDENAVAALTAPPDELTFYGQQMCVQPYVSTNRRRTFSASSFAAMNASGDASSNPIAAGPSLHTPADERSLSRSSSIGSMTSNSSSATTFALDELPPRVLERVFAHSSVLDRVRLERVSKRFLEASVASWRTADGRLSFASDRALASHFTTSSPLRDAHLRAVLARAGVHLKVLDLSGVPNLLSDKAVANIAQDCPGLVELDLSGVQTSPASLQALSEGLPKLRRLAYRDMSTSGDKPFWYLFKTAGNRLTHVDLRGAKRMKGRCFKLCGMCLEEVLLDGCSRIDDETIDDLCLRSGNVHTLRLNGCPGVSDGAISTISRHMSDLRDFTLCGDKFPKLTSAGLAPLTRLDTLTRLQLDHNPAVDDEFMSKLSTSVKSLQKLSLAFAGTDTSLTSTSLLGVGYLPNLVELDLSGLGAVNNALSSALVAGCPELKTVLLRNCAYLGDEGVSGFGGLDKLIHLDLSACILVTAAPIQALVKAFKAHKDAPVPEESVTIVVGGTNVEPSQVRIRESRVILDFEDYSSNSLTVLKQFVGTKDASADPDSDEDNDFELLEAHRSFIVDALQDKDDFQLDGMDETAIREWAEREAAELGLMSEAPSRS
uniref:F-box domain-containing protein n=1 Tax=Panagrellus redivivus TaxID=6233 RepID=A0A7E4ZXM8_PANRE